MSKNEYYQSHLDRVSRSFAFCIARLDSPLRSWVSLTYLLCRVLDTVEDARWLKKNKQLESFLDFERMIDSAADNGRIKEWIAALPTDLTEGEKLLMADSTQLFSDLHEAPLTVKTIIQSLTGSMARGMRHFVARGEDGHLRLRNLQEVNQYCFFVAGIVGEALSQLLSVIDSKVQVSRKFLIDAHHFGLFLQKVNLLKDQTADEHAGRFLISSRDDVYQSIRANADGAMAYIEAIPLSHRSYRFFCVSSLFLGLATLPQLKTQSSTDAGYKLDRNKTMQLFQLLESLVEKPPELRSYFNSLLQLAQLNDDWKDSGANTYDISWIKSAYSGSLDGVDFLELKMA